MEIKFGGAPRIQVGCFLRAEPPVKPGHRLKPEYVRLGRPEIIKTILVVDDDPDFLRIARDILESLDFKVILINPKKPIKEQVLNLVSKQRIDLTTMDRQMPGISGEALIKELRSKDYNGYIAANSGNDNEQEKMLLAGADFPIPDIRISINSKVSLSLKLFSSKVSWMRILFASLLLDQKGQRY